VGKKWRGVVPMTEEIATETWEDVNSISKSGIKCAFELVILWRYRSS
jgi:hypothetical protein